MSKWFYGHRGAGTQSRGLSSLWLGVSVAEKAIWTDVTTLAGSHGLRLVIGLGISVALARYLGPEALGVYSVIGATITIVFAMSDFGLSQTFVARLAEAKHRIPELRRSISLLFFLKMSTGLVFTSLLILLAQAITEHVLKLPGAAPAFTLAAAGLLVSSLTSAASTVFHGLTRFKTMMSIYLVSGSVNLLILIALAQFAVLNISTAIVAGILGNVVAFAFVQGALLAPFQAEGPAPARGGPLQGRNRIANFLQGLRQAPSERFAQLVRFSGWIWVSSVFVLLASYLDLFLVSRYMPAREAGLYALALNLSLKAQLLSSIQHTVLLPRVSALPLESGNAGLRGFAVSAWKRIGLVIVTLLVMYPFLPTLVERIYGAEYLASGGLLQWLLWVIVLDLLTTPLQLLVFPLNRPGLLAFTDICKTALMGLLAYLLLPSWGLTGVIVAKIASRLFALLFMGGRILQHLRS